MTSTRTHPNHTKPVQQDILDSHDRDRVISWLVWNDPNGIYTDNDSIREGLDPLTLADAVATMRHQLEN